MSTRLFEYLTETYHGGTKRACAEKLGIAPTSLQNYFGGREPRASLLRKIHETYDISYEKLFELLKEKE